MKNATTASARSQLPSYDDCLAATANPDGSARILRFNGLMLYVQKSGKKTWRCKVQRQGRATMLTLGYFPKVSISKATAAFALVRSAEDPAQARRDAQAKRDEASVNTFRALAERWLAIQGERSHWEPKTRDAYMQRFARDVFPTLGHKPIAEIGKTEVTDLLWAISNGRKADKSDGRPALAASIGQMISGVYDYAISVDAAPMNPVRVMKKWVPVRQHNAVVNAHHPFMKTIDEARAALAAVEQRRNLQDSTRLAYRLMALTGCRKMEIVEAAWSEVDLAAKWWTIPAERMKGKHGHKVEHKVALSAQAIEVFEAMAKVSNKRLVADGEGTGGTDRVFDLSRDTLNDAMLRAGVAMPPHGWRGTFSTIMNDLDESNFRIVDAMLAHSTFRGSAETSVRKNTSERSYNHAAYLTQRHRVAQEWADLLLDGSPSALALVGRDEAVTASNVVPLRKAA